VTALLALALAAAPGCPEAIAAAAGLDSPRDLGLAAPAVVAGLVHRGAGGPADALAFEAEAFAEAARSGEGDLAAMAERFRSRLARHCALAAQAPAGAALRPGDRHALEEILSRPEFRQARADRGAVGRWLAELWRRILDLLGTSEAGRYAAGGRTLFFAAVAAAMAAALAWSVRRRRGGRTAREHPRAHAAPSALAPPDRSEALARSALQDGDWAEAVRHAFLMLLGALERHGRVPRGRARTNRELASHLAAAGPGPAPALAGGFADLAVRFDGTVYGGAPVGAGEAAAFLERAVELRALCEGAP
jgi:hypothetical protein